MKRFLYLSVLLLGFVACSDSASPTDAAADRRGEDSSPPAMCPPTIASCKPIGGCGIGVGLLGEGACENSGSAGLVCCFELDECPPEDFTCCVGSTVFRPICQPSRRELACESGIRCPP